MKKKILFMVINMNVGGTEKALLNMIAELPKDEYDITIFMLEEYGGFLNSIPVEVNVEYLNGYGEIKDLLNKPSKIVVFDLIKEWRVGKAFNVFLLHLISKVIRNRSLFFKYILGDYPDVKDVYDVAVAYAGPMDFISFFVVNKIKAKKKFQWIHFDITKIGFNKKFASKIYNQFDKVFVVSEEARKKLDSAVPSLTGKTEVFNNMISMPEIHTQSKHGTGFEDDFDGVRILTVGRLSIEKGQDLAIQAFARLIADGYNVKWYCIGDGSIRGKYEQLIEDFNLREKFFILGSNPNPYPYMAQCDIYVQPSRYEGYCVTIMEAKCFNKPIVTTEVNGAKEQIKDGETGLIVDIDEKEIYHAVKKILESREFSRKLSKNLYKENENQIPNRNLTHTLVKL